ncbi:ATP-binding protein [Halobellus salinus]|nr:DUF87 domain-containing protein [Halobellus salinus]SMP05653.1 protein of unknown function DUF87 [Halobellus salinus]
MAEDTETIAVANVSDGPGGDGADDPGAPVDLPVVDILTGRGFITGKSGSGKSNTASVMIESLLDKSFPVLIVDTDGEYYGLKEQFELLHAGADEECDIVVSPEHAEKIAALALEENVPIILDVSGYLDDDEAQELLTEVAKSLFAKEKKLKKPFLLLVEECHEYLPEGGGMTEAGQMLIKIGKRGRKHGLGIVGISQRPADVKKDFITQCDWLVWHRLTWDNDTKVVGRILGSSYADAVEGLGDGEAFLATDWSGSLRRVQFHKKRTFDAGATPGLEDFERPELKSIDGDLVSELETISDSQARRESEIADLRRELDEKDAAIRELERELEEARDLSRMADRFAQAMFRTANAPYRGVGNEVDADTAAVGGSDDSQTGTSTLDEYGDADASGDAVSEAATSDTGTADGPGATETDADAEAAVTAAAAEAYPGHDTEAADAETSADVAPERAHRATDNLTGRADVIDRLRGVVASLPDAAQRMLAFYREVDACDPVDAHVAAGEVGDTRLAYSQNRLLRRAGFVEHVGRGRYAYALPGLVREEFADRLEAGELRAVAAAVEAEFAPGDGDTVAAGARREADTQAAAPPGREPAPGANSEPTGAEAGSE